MLLPSKKYRLERFTEKHFSEWTYFRKTVGRMYISPSPNGHFS